MKLPPEIWHQVSYHVKDRKTFHNLSCLCKDSSKIPYDNKNFYRFLFTVDELQEITRSYSEELEKTYKQFYLHNHKNNKISHSPCYRKFRSAINKDKFFLVMKLLETHKIKDDEYTLPGWDPINSFYVHEEKLLSFAKSGEMVGLLTRTYRNTLRLSCITILSNLIRENKIDHVVAFIQNIGSEKELENCKNLWTRSISVGMLRVLVKFFNLPENFYEKVIFNCETSHQMLTIRALVNYGIDINKLQIKMGRLSFEQLTFLRKLGMKLTKEKINRLNMRCLIDLTENEVLDYSDISYKGILDCLKNTKHDCVKVISNLIKGQMKTMGIYEYFVVIKFDRNIKEILSLFKEYGVKFAEERNFELIEKMDKNNLEEHLEFIDLYYGIDKTKE